MLDGLKRTVLLVAVALLAACASVDVDRAATLDDATITAQVKTAILREPNLRILPIRVQTTNGIVQLSGFADTTQKSALAAELASSITGVKTVQNSIIIRSRDSRDV